MIKLKKLPVRIIEFAQYVLFRIVCVAINLVPFSLAMKLGKLGGRLLYFLLPRYRSVALENLRFAFNREKTENEIRRIAIQSFENLGMFAIEFIRIPKILKCLSKYIVIENDESVFDALKRKKGVVLIVSHFGNWEWMGVAAGARVKEKGAKINAVARVLGNLFLYHYAVDKLRGATGLKTIDKRGAARKAMELLERNEIVCILVDQHERYGSVPVPYFGRDAWTSALPAVLAMKKDTAVIPVFSFRKPGKPTLVKLGEPFPVIRTGDYERDLIENTKQYIQAIEAVVGEHPGDWLWMHARWRSSRTAKAHQLV